MDYVLQFGEIAHIYIYATEYIIMVITNIRTE